ncbi:MAG TPA: DUF58 domain-containing protein [Gemmatimonadota bacterium]|nr:DUF58 domain-containing protein [Gemmatimonadota bacterium]
MAFGLLRGRRSRPPETPPAAEVSELVRRLEIQARKLMENRALGAYDAVFRGHGIEFAEVRAYEPGDPFNAIDWKVTARVGRPYVKRFVEERELGVLLVVDVSGSSGFGTRRRTKRDLATDIAALLGLAATRNNDRVGLMLFSDEVDVYRRPQRGRQRLRRLLHELVSTRSEGRGTDLGLALRTAGRVLKTRSLVFILSDFRDSGFGRDLAALSRRHDVVGFRLSDPAELSLPKAGLIEVRDPETGQVGLLDLGDADVRAAIVERAGAREAAAVHVLRRASVDQLALSTDRPYAGELAAFFARRARARLK